MNILLQKCQAGLVRQTWNAICLCSLLLLHTYGIHGMQEHIGKLIPSHLIPKLMLLHIEENSL